MSKAEKDYMIEKCKEYWLFPIEQVFETLQFEEKRSLISLAQTLEVTLHLFKAREYNLRRGSVKVKCLFKLLLESIAILPPIV